jgi:hypothetical protein
MRIIEVLSVAMFAASAVFVLGVSLRRRRSLIKLETERNRFIATGLLERGYLVGGPGTEDAIQKLERLLADLDSEWHWQNQSAMKPGSVETLTSYIGNTGVRSAQI